MSFLGENDHHSKGETAVSEIIDNYIRDYLERYQAYQKYWNYEDGCLLMGIKRMYGYDDLDMRDICQKILTDYNLKMLVLTCGTNGSYVFAPGLTSFQETPKVTVADTVGAGDSFTGSFCAAILNGKPMEEAHRIAVEVSAYVCTQNGAMPTYPESLVAKVK